MTTSPVVQPDTHDPDHAREACAHLHVALLGQPNVGKTTLFNRLSGARHRTANFPGATQEARYAALREADSTPPELRDAELIDLPGVYSLELEANESRLVSGVLEGSVAPVGHAPAAPDRLLLIADATNLPRSLVLVGEAARRRLPMAVAVNRIDAARRRGLAIDAERLSRALGCPVTLVSARTGEGLDRLPGDIAQARIPSAVPEPGADAAERFADELFLAAVPTPAEARSRRRSRTDLADRVLLHPLAGPLVFAAVMAGLFWTIFKLATYPMDWIDAAFARLADAVAGALPTGAIADLLTGGVIGGVGATAVFVPQIFLLFFLLALLEETGYLARAAFVIDRWLRPFGLPGHAFVPLLSSHACALPGIIACRAIPGRRERLAAILVAPFMSCTARIPVYVLLTTLLFRDRPALAALAFMGCYVVGALAGLFSALVARLTILRGRPAPMALELPDFRPPRVKDALSSAGERAWMFLRKAGGVILAISIVLWWLSSYPKVAPPAEAEALRAQAAQAVTLAPEETGALMAEADRVEARHAASESYAGRLGRAAQPVFAPLGYDWQLTVGVITSFAAREVFVSTMAVITAGRDDPEADGVLEALAGADRSDGSALFTPAVAWSLLVYYILAMQCLPTLVVTAREAGGVKWALLQLAWMGGLAYLGALLTYQTLRALGVS